MCIKLAKLAIWIVHYVCDFYALEVVGHSSETQLQVGEHLFSIILRSKV